MSAPLDGHTIGELERWLQGDAHLRVMEHVRERIAKQFLGAPLSDPKHLQTLRMVVQGLELYEESLKSLVRKHQLSEAELARTVNLQSRTRQR